MLARWNLNANVPYTLLVLIDYCYRSHTRRKLLNRAVIVKHMLRSKWNSTGIKMPIFGPLVVSGCRATRRSISRKAELRWNARLDIISSVHLTKPTWLSTGGFHFFIHLYSIFRLNIYTMDGSLLFLGSLQREREREKERKRKGRKSSYIPIPSSD